MRVEMPEEYQDRPFEHIGKCYAPEIANAAGAYGTAAYQHSKLSLRELEAARFRTAQINGCNTCTSFRGGRDFPGLFDVFQGDIENSVYSHGPAPDEEFYRNVENWRDWPGFSERERLAIRMAEGIGTAPQEIARDEDFWARAKAAFSDEEIVDMTYAIGSWIANGRALHVLGLDTVCAFVPAGAAA